MTIVIFIIILLVLVLIHEAGHFFAAKISGVKVEEFAFGFPPRLFSVKKGETRYAFNLIPLGGYVKIYGENGEEEKASDQEKSEENKAREHSDKKRSFVHKHPILQIFMLSAGVIMNFLLAYVLITASAYINTTFAIDEGSQEYQTLVEQGRVRNQRMIIANVIENSPAASAGLEAGDRVTKISANQENSTGQVVKSKDISLNQSGDDLAENVSETINDEDSQYNDSLTIEYEDAKGKLTSTTLAGVYGLDEATDKKMLGLAFTRVADVNLKFLDTLKLGFEKTVEYTKLTIVGFKGLVVNLFEHGSLSKDISGPVGIIHEVGQARTLGFNYLLLFTAVLSISLAVFNILPFPALDGGRILFVIIEWITRKKIPAKWQGILNGVGFALLILLMVWVTIHDVRQFF